MTNGEYVNSKKYEGNPKGLLKAKLSEIDGKIESLIACLTYPVMAGLVRETSYELMEALRKRKSIIKELNELGFEIYA